MFEVLLARAPKGYMQSVRRGRQMANHKTENTFTTALAGEPHVSSRDEKRFQPKIYRILVCRYRHIQYSFSESNKLLTALAIMRAASCSRASAEVRIV